MATPRVFGQELRLTANLCFARDASEHQSACVLHSQRFVRDDLRQRT